MADKGPPDTTSLDTADGLMSILDQMADSVQMDYTNDFTNPNAKDTEPSSSGIHGIHGIHDQDEKYWERRRKNNLAAKKSRDARKIRENQLKCKVACLENANQVLRAKLEREVRKNQDLNAQLDGVKSENKALKQRLYPSEN